MTVIKETSTNHLSEPQHQIYCEPIIIDQEKLIADKNKKKLVSQGKRNSADKITVMAKKKKKMKKLLTLQWFHAKMIYPES